jgi:hypothetical protein
VRVACMGAKLRFGDATNSSPPPCGEGMGVGVGRYGATVRHGTPPHPPPSRNRVYRVSATQQSDRNRQQPIRLGKESRVAKPNLNLAPVRVARPLTAFRRIERSPNHSVVPVREDDAKKPFHEWSNARTRHS